MLDLKKARTEEMRGSGTYSSRDDRDKMKWEFDQKNHLQNEATPRDKSIETSQEKGKSLNSRREYDNYTPSSGNLSL